LFLLRGSCILEGNAPMFWRSMSVMRAGYLAMLACSTLCAQEFGDLKAKIGKPVIQETLGGCSLTCAFPWEAVAGTSRSADNVPALNDADVLTAWTNASVGDTLIFKFPSNLPRELNDTSLLRHRYCQWTPSPGGGLPGFWTHQEDPPSA
jgi:hypothetical protein